MTTRPAFGDFLMAARRHVSAAVAGHQWLGINRPTFCSAQPTSTGLAPG